METVLQFVTAETELPLVAACNRMPAAGSGSKILRFAKSERTLHWAIGGPFLVSFATGAILVVLYNPDPSRPWRQLLAMLHRISGIALAILPMLALLHGRRDVRLHIYNIGQAWTWIYDDFKWLALMGLAAISSRFTLPEQGKFNAAEKLNFMVLMSTYPLYVATGLLMWAIPLAVLSWILHCLMAMMATPLVLGHLYMALINKGTRPGLEGMISGHVDRHWARHHYGHWYKKHYGEEEVQPNGASPLNAGRPTIFKSDKGLDNTGLPAPGGSLVVPQSIMHSAMFGHSSRLVAQVSGEEKQSYDFVAVFPTYAGMSRGEPVLTLTPHLFIRLCEQLGKTDNVRTFHEITRRTAIWNVFGEQGENVQVQNRFCYPDLKMTPTFTANRHPARIRTVCSSDRFLNRPAWDNRYLRFKLPGFGPSPARPGRAMIPSSWAAEFRHFPKS